MNGEFHAWISEKHYIFTNSLLVKKLFYIALSLLIVFEFCNVYFLMPMPGSQKVNSLELAYFLYSKRWFFRLALLILLLWSFRDAWKKSKILLLITVGVTGILGVIINGPMTAASMFKPIKTKVFVNGDSNKIAPNELVIAVVENNEAKAYPIEMIGYHHRIFDTVGGKAVFVTYCTVCRTGRVYNPIIDGKGMDFRLVGMDHFNAMFEDKETHSWWRQATGEACIGELKGKKMPEVNSMQLTVAEFLQQFPQGLILQRDPLFDADYNDLKDYTSGKSKGKLTGTDSLSWKAKSWVLGIDGEGKSYAYDWNRLKKEKFICDTLNGQSLVIILGNDGQSFFSFWVPLTLQEMKSLKYDAGNLVSEKFRISDKGQLSVLSANPENLPIHLRTAPVYQEFWHSWQSFHKNIHQRL